MKKTFRILSLLVLVALSVCMLTACGKTLSGSYKATIITDITYEFSGKDVTVTVAGGIFKDLVLEGKYEIGEDEEGSAIITFTFESEDEEADEYSGVHSFSEGEEDGVKYIKIDGVKYTKVE